MIFILKLQASGLKFLIEYQYKYFYFITMQFICQSYFSYFSHLSASVKSANESLSCSHHHLFLSTDALFQYNDPFISHPINTAGSLSFYPMQFPGIFPAHDVIQSRIVPIMPCNNSIHQLIMLPGTI